VLTTNQGLILPDDADNANVPLTFTDFVTTAGSGMENRLVQRYLSSVDRTARNAAPNEGELSYLSDSDVYEWYNGTAWVPLSKGYVGESARIVNSAGFTNATEIITDSITFTSLGPTIRYKLSFYGNCQSTVGNDAVSIRFRYQAGAALTIAGTQFDISELTMPTIVRSFPLVRSRTVTGIAAGQTTIGVGMIRVLGTGTLTSTGAAGQVNYSLLEIV